MKRLLRIEQAKAKERQGERNDLKNIPQISAESKSESREVVASQFGISRDTMKKEMSIVDNKDLLSPEGIPDRVYGFSIGFYIFRIQIFSKKKKAQIWAYLASSCQNFITQYRFWHPCQNAIKTMTDIFWAMLTR